MVPCEVYQSLIFPTYASTVKRACETAREPDVRKQSRKSMRDCSRAQWETSWVVGSYNAQQHSHENKKYAIVAVLNIYIHALFSERANARRHFILSTSTFRVETHKHSHEFIKAWFSRLTHAVKIACETTREPDVRKQSGKSMRDCSWAQWETSWVVGNYSAQQHPHENKKNM